MVVELPKMTLESSFKKENVDNSSVFNFSEPEFFSIDSKNLYRAAFMVIQAEHLSAKVCITGENWFRNLWKTHQKGNLERI